MCLRLDEYFSRLRVWKDHGLLNVDRSFCGLLSGGTRVLERIDYHIIECFVEFVIQSPSPEFHGYLKPATPRARRLVLKGSRS